MTDKTEMLKLIELTADLAAAHTASRVCADLNDMRECVARIDERTKQLPTMETVREETAGAIHTCQQSRGLALSKKQWAQLISIVLALLSAITGVNIVLQ